MAVSNRLPAIVVKQGAKNSPAVLQQENDNN
jgi:hypothetical protein